MGLLSANAPMQSDCPYLDKDDRWSSHTQIKTWMADLRPGTRVLDIGAATGTLGKHFTNAGLVLHGIEPHSTWANMARPYYNQLFCGALDDAPDAFISGHDIVVCADVLEHIADPKQSLRRLLDLQPVGCQFLISLPNIANIWIRLNLLMGRFEYTDRGILDRTHLRFFTRSSVREMLSSVGLQIVQLRVTPIPLNLVHSVFQQTSLGRSTHVGLAHLTRAFPTLLGYQFVIKTVKSS